MENDLISIITPVYNEEKYLEEMIESVQSQSYKFYEHLIVDDYSSDSSIEIVEKIKQKDSRIKLFTKKVNGGVSRARNLAINEAKGNYIAFLDADDRWLPDKLKFQIRSFHQNPEIGLLGTRRLFIDDKGERIFIDESESRNYWGKFGVDEFILDRIPLVTSSVVVKKECLDRCGLFKDQYQLCEDYELWYRILKKYPIGILNEALVEYRVHEKNVSKNKIINNLNKIQVFENEVMPDLELFGKRKKEFIAKLQKYYISSGKMFLKKNEKDEADKLFKKAINANGGSFILSLKGAFYKTINRIF